MSLVHCPLYNPYEDPVRTLGGVVSRLPPSVARIVESGTTSTLFAILDSHLNLSGDREAPDAAQNIKVDPITPGIGEADMRTLLTSVTNASAAPGANAALPVG
ncbi:MAG: hypothetical protein ABEI52_13350, partial [Halobacteriaceae archaeon]